MPNRPPRPPRNGPKHCNGWCPPTIIYLVLSLVGLSMRALTGRYRSEHGLMLFLIQLAFIGFWTWVMYWLCSMCWGGWAWFVLLFPLILGLVLFVLFELEVLAFLKRRSTEDRKVTVHRSYRVYY